MDDFLICLCSFFFFFKQKTAYEMRISDWSSDVCSSDLKRTPEADYPRKGRGTQGVIALQTTARNGKLVGAIQLSEQHEVLLISDGGTLEIGRASCRARVCQYV